MDSEPLDEIAALSSATEITAFRECLVRHFATRDTIDLEYAVNVARLAARWREHETVCQIVCRSIVDIGARPSADLFDEAADLLFDSLAASNMPDQASAEWIQAVFVQIGSPSTAGAIDHIREMLANRAAIPARTMRIFGLLKNSLQIRPHSPRRQVWIYPIICAAIAIIACMLVFNSWIPPIPLGETLIGPLLWKAILFVWLPLLLVTWIAMFVNARRSRAIHSIPPEITFKGRQLIAGHHQGFSTDIFFHVFAFIWIPLIAIMILAEFRIPEVAQTLSQLPATTIGDLSRDALAGSTISIGDAWNQNGIIGLVFNSQLAMIAGIAVAIISLLVQCALQHERIDSSVDIFWWDLRIGRPVWLTRLVMVGVSMFFATICVQKTMLMMLLFAGSTFQSGLPFDALHPDGLGGLAAIRDGLNLNAWAAFVFGLFVFSSWYLHNGLPQYKWIDRAMGAIYVAIAILCVVVPFILLQSQISVALDSFIERLRAQYQDDNHSLLEQFVLQQIQSSVLKFDFINSPIFILAAQAVLLGVRWIRTTHSRVRIKSDRWSFDESH